MNVTCKRLLSWLVVVTMVLSMVPVMDLSNFAVTTKAATENPGQAVIDAAKALGTFAAPEDGATTIEKICPVCSSETAVTWTNLNSVASTTDLASGHYYLTDTITTQIKPVQASATKVCLNLNGNNVNVAASLAIYQRYGTTNIIDTAENEGTVIGYNSGTASGAVYVQNGGDNAKVNIYGGIYKKYTKTGDNTKYSAVVSITSNGGIVNMYGGVIDGKTGFDGTECTVNNVSYPTSVYLAGTSDTVIGKFNMYGGEIIGGNGGTSDVGGVRVNANQIFNLYGGTVRDGQGRSGGNFALVGGKLNMYGGTVSGGQAASTTDYLGGGNIYITAGGTLNMEGGVISGGQITGSKGVGGNIAIRDEDSYYGTVTISGGKIIDGTAKTKGDNIYVRGNATNKTTLTISGGQISSGIAMGDNVTFSLSGDPVIKVSGIEGQTVDATAGFAVTNGGELDVSKITGGEIQVEGELGDVFSAAYDDAATVAQYFSCTTDGWWVKANAENKLQIQEIPAPEQGTFDPEGCGGMAYCDACIKAGRSEEEALVKWTPISGTDLAAINSVGAGNAGRNYYHYYLSGDASFSGNAFTFTTNSATTCVNLNGKALTAGDRAIVLNYGSTVNIMDTEGGSVTGKYTGLGGAAIHVNNPSAIVNIYGGTFKKDSNSAKNANVVRMEYYGGTINMYGGTINATGVEGASAQPGIYMTATQSDTRKAIFNMYDGEIIGAATTGDGGAVYLATRATFNMYKGTVSGGKARAGGNFMVRPGTTTVDGETVVNPSSTLNIYGGTISAGESTNDHASVTGGNIAVADGGVVNMEGGVVCNGVAVQNGGNIALWYNENNSVQIVGGKIYGGVASTSGANIYSNGLAGSALTIGGTAEIAGDIKTNSTTTNTLSGTPKILTSGLYAADGTTAVTGTTGLDVTSTSNISVTGVTGGEIQVTGAADVAFSAACDNAEDVAQYFKSTAAQTNIKVENNKLVIREILVPEKENFNPEECDGYAYCPVCNSDEPVLWTALSSTSTTSGLATGHYYLTANITTSISVTPGSTVCINLNGKNVTTSGAAVGTGNGTLNVMDTAGTSIVTGSGTSNGATINLNGANASDTVNIYGGTWKKDDSVAEAAIVSIGGNGGTINMYGGTIDASSVTNTTNPTAVFMTGGIYNAETNQYAGKATFNMHGGTIKGGMSTGFGSAIRIGNGTTTYAEFNLRGGTISGGKTGNTSSDNVGGCIYVNAGTLNVYAGTIENGEYNRNLSSLGGGNIAIANGGKLYMDGGTISGGNAGVGAGGNIFIRDTTYGTVEIYGGKVINGTAATGANIAVNGNASKASTLIIGGTAQISGGIVTGANVNITLSGTPQIKTTGIEGQEETAAYGLTVTASSNINVSGLTEGAEIQVTSTEDVAFSAAWEQAADVAQYFSATVEGYKIKVNDNDQLVVYLYVPEIGVFEPWNHNGYAYCQACGNLEPVQWQIIDSEFVGGTSLDHDTHWYLSEDITDASVNSTGYYISKPQKSASKLCIELNGKKLTVSDGRVFMNAFYMGTLNVMDTTGGAVVTGNGDSSSGAVFYLNGVGGSSKVNVYGGTFKTANASSVVYIGGNGGTFNLYGGTLDASGATEGVIVGAFGMQGSNADNADAIFNMYGGEIIGDGELAGRVGTILQVNATSSFMNCATFNMTAGTISGGYVQVRNDNTATISGGTIEHLTVIDGAYGAGSNDLLEGDHEIKDSDGTVTGTLTVDYSGETTVTLSGTPQITHMNIGTDVVVDISGLTDGAEIAIDGKTDVALMTANEDTQVMAGITAYAAEKYVDVVESYVYLKLAEAAVVTAEDENGKVKEYWRTVADALSNVGEGQYIELQVTGLTIELTSDAYIDNRGHTATVTGNGTLYAMDWANDDYDGHGTWNVADGVTVINDVINPVNGNRYIVIQNTNGTYDAHRIQMYLTGISLRPSAAGLYYRAAYKCDDKLAALVDEYGIVYNAVNTDEILAFNAAGNVPSIITGFAGKMENHAVSGTSTLVYGIFKDSRDAGENKVSGETPINATPYIKIGEQVVLGNVEDTVHNAAYRTNNGTIHANMSMYNVLEYMNDNWDEARYGSVKSFYQTWYGKGIEAWAAKLPNISGYVASEEEA